MRDTCWASIPDQFRAPEHRCGVKCEAKCQKDKDVDGCLLKCNAVCKECNVLTCEECPYQATQACRVHKVDPVKEAKAVAAGEIPAASVIVEKKAEEKPAAEKKETADEAVPVVEPAKAEPEAPKLPKPLNPSAAAIKVTSTAFADHAELKKVFTCDDFRQFTPPLAWSAGKAAGKIQSYALVMHAVDNGGAAPEPSWVAYSIPASRNALPEHVPNAAAVLDGVKQGVNAAGTFGYDAPCPKQGTTQQYVFTVYGLSSSPSIAAGEKWAKIRQTIMPSVIAEGSVAAVYTRSAEK